MKKEDGTPTQADQSEPIKKAVFVDPRNRVRRLADRTRQYFNDHNRHNPNDSVEITRVRSEDIKDLEAFLYILWAIDQEGVNQANEFLGNNRYLAGILLVILSQDYGTGNAPLHKLKFGKVKQVQINTDCELSDQFSTIFSAIEKILTPRR